MVNRSKTPSSGHEQNKWRGVLFLTYSLSSLSSSKTSFVNFPYFFCNICDDKQKPGDPVLQLNNLFLNLVYRRSRNGHYHRKTHDVFDEENPTGTKLVAPFKISIVLFVALNAYSFLIGTSLGAVSLQIQVLAKHVQ